MLKTCDLFLMKPATCVQHLQLTCLGAFFQSILMELASLATSSVFFSWEVFTQNHTWLVVSTHLKNISQLG